MVSATYKIAHSPSIEHECTYESYLKRQVAIKLLPPELTRDETAKQRFLQEAQAASALDHPNICTIYEINETPEGQLYLVMAYYEGETLQQKIERGPLPIDEALDMVRGVKAPRTRSVAAKRPFCSRRVAASTIYTPHDAAAAGTRIGSYHATAKIGEGERKHLQRATNTVWRHQCSHAHSIRMRPPL